MRRRGLLLLILLMTPVLAQAGKVSVDFDSSFDFSAVRSVAWGDGGSYAESELDQRRIERAVESSLEKSGLELLEEDADLIVVTHAIIGSEIKTKGGGLGVGLFKSTSWGGVSIGGSGGRQTEQVPTGTLQVELIDAETGALVWEGIARDALVGSAAKSEERIAKAVERMFRKFPPDTGDKKKQK